MWDLLLDFLSATEAIISVSKQDSATAKVVWAVHIIYLFHFLVEEIWLLSQQVAYVDRYANRGNGHRIVGLCLENLNISL